MNTPDKPTRPSLWIQPPSTGSASITGSPKLTSEKESSEIEAHLIACLELLEEHGEYHFARENLDLIKIKGKFEAVREVYDRMHELVSVEFIKKHITLKK